MITTENQLQNSAIEDLKKRTVSWAVFVWVIGIVMLVLGWLIVAQQSINQAHVVGQANLATLNQSKVETERRLESIERKLDELLLRVKID